MVIPGYKIISKLHSTDTITVYRGERLGDHTPVILKIHSAEFPENSDIARLKHEYEIMNGVKLHGVIRVCSLEKVEHRYLLVLEDSPNTFTLSEWIKTHDLNINTFLTVAINLALSVFDLHNSHIIHKDINPSNIIIDEKTKQVKLIGFSISSRLVHEKQEVVSPEKMEGSFAYMSPEQTGRMNHSIDQRSDLYSLGIIFYEMLLGQLPFHASTPLEWMYCHLSSIPKPLAQVKPSIPEVLSNIVMRLLAKEPDDRYATAYGLISDLERFQEAWLKNPDVPISFPLGEKDHTSYFQIPQKLYGREAEVNEIIKAVSEVNRGILFVSGYSGIGKTSIVNEAHKPIAKEHGYFVYGKFEQYQQTTPYFALIQALRKLINQLLSESKDRVIYWSEQLINALGPNGKLIADVIPEVEVLIGKQLPVQMLPPSESRTRFELVFFDFVRTFACHDYPLVIFLDDMQWADLATLDLIKQLLRDTSLKHLLIIGAYRDNEVSEAHPLKLMMNDLDKHHVPVINLCVKPLDLPSVKQLVSDTLYSKESSESLADLIYQKTGGNPFFAITFLHMLYEENYIEFDTKLGHWVWDMSILQKLAITDNVVDLVVNKITKLPKETQEALKLAACVGNQFDLKTLAIVAEQTLGDSARLLWPALQEHLLIPLSEEYKLVMADVNYDAINQRVLYKFSHDRVQQAALSLLTTNQRKLIDIRLARLLRANLMPEEADENIFEIVNHFNSALDLLTNEQERHDVALLNLRAGDKARGAVAYDSASIYYENSSILLGEAGWDTSYKERFEAGVGHAECMHLMGKFTMADELFGDLIKRSKTKLDKTRIAMLQTLSYTIQGKYEQAATVALNGLRILGVKVNPHPGIPTVIYELSLVMWRLRKKTIDDILKLPKLTDPEQLQITYLLERLGIAVYLTNPLLLSVLHMRGIRHCLDHGYSSVTSIFFTVYATILVSGFNRFEAAYQYSKLGAKIADEYDDMRIKTIAYFGRNILVDPWVRPYKECFNQLDKVYHIGRQAGELLYTGYAAALTPQIMLVQGDELIEVEKKLKAVAVTADFTGNVDVLGSIHTLESMLPALKGDKPVSYFHERVDMFLQNAIAYAHPVTYGTSGVLCLMTSYLFDNFDDAVEISKRTRKYVKADYMRPVFIVSEFYFYSALTYLTLYKQAGFLKRLKYDYYIRDSLKMLCRWAKSCKENYGSKYYLLLGARYHAKGNMVKAMKAYDQAILLAREQGHEHIEAIINEFIGRMYYAENVIKFGKLHMQQAAFLYKRWGAIGKVNLLQEKYPEIIVSE